MAAPPMLSNEPIQETSLSATTNTSSSGPYDRLNDSEPASGTSNSNGSTFRPAYGSVAAVSSTSTSNAAANKPPPSTRLVAPDLLRGLLMTFMAMDHNVIASRAWPHGVNPIGEKDGAVVHRWNWPVAIFVRELSHNCAPGFILLLGIGIVLMTQSRRRKGWKTPGLVRHLVIRVIALTVVQFLLGVAMTGGSLIFVNMVLFAIAIDYFLAGMLWLGIEETEGVVARLVDRFYRNYVAGSDGNDDEESLLAGRSTVYGDNDDDAKAPPTRKATLAAYHLGNLVLGALAVVTLCWNQWLSPTHGHCPPDDAVPPPSSPGAADFWRFWFYQLEREHFISSFPPLAWLAPALLGLLYARVVYLRPQPLSKHQLASANAALSLFLAVLFVLTRLLHFGNLTEDCIRIDGETPQPGRNQYLQSVVAFLYVSKYPPDAAFYFYTLSVNFLMLALFGLCSYSFSVKWMKPLLVYGQSSLFFYVVHLGVLHLGGFILIPLFGQKTDFLDPLTGRPLETDGLGSFGYFFNWAVCLAIMYPLCICYGRFKHTKGPDSLWRFF